MPRMTFVNLPAANLDRSRTACAAPIKLGETA